MMVDRVGVGVHRFQAAAEHGVQVAQHLPAAIQDHHPRAHADCHLGRVEADRPAADDGHLGRPHTRHATEQYARAAHFLFEAAGAGLDRQPARHLGHRLQQGQVAPAVGDRFVGDARGSRVHQFPGLLRVRRQVQVGEEHLVLAQHGALHGLRLLDLDDQPRLVEHLRRSLQDCGAGLLVFLVGHADAFARAGFHEHLVPAAGQFVNRRRGETHPVLVIFYFFWHTDLHYRPPVNGLTILFG